MYVNIENAMECRKNLREFLEGFNHSVFSATQFKKNLLSFCEKNNLVRKDCYGNLLRYSDTAPCHLDTMLTHEFIVKIGEEPCTHKGKVYHWRNKTWNAEWKVSHYYYEFLINSCDYKLTLREFWKDVKVTEEVYPATRFLYTVNWEKVEKILGE